MAAATSVVAACSELDDPQLARRSLRRSRCKVGVELRAWCPSEWDRRRVVRQCGWSLLPLRKTGRRSNAWSQWFDSYLRSCCEFSGQYRVGPPVAASLSGHSGCEVLQGGYAPSQATVGAATQRFRRFLAQANLSQSNVVGWPLHGRALLRRICFGFS